MIEDLTEEQVASLVPDLMDGGTEYDFFRLSTWDGRGGGTIPPGTTWASSQMLLRSFDLFFDPRFRAALITHIEGYLDDDLITDVTTVKRFGRRWAEVNTFRLGSLTTDVNNSFVITWKISGYRIPCKLLSKIDDADTWTEEALLSRASWTHTFSGETTSSGVRTYHFALRPV